MIPPIRMAGPADVEALARLWYDGWHDAHAAVVPAALTRLRTLPSFAERIAHDLTDLRVAGQAGAPAGFCIVKGDELYQLFVDAGARRSGVASALAADAEARIRLNGHVRARLDCAIGNDRAAAFYRARGWICTGTVRNAFETTEGPFEMEVWRFEKGL